MTEPHSERPADVIREWFVGGSKKRWRTSCWHRAPDDVIAALDSIEEQYEAHAKEKSAAVDAANHWHHKATRLQEQVEAVRQLVLYEWKVKDHNPVFVLNTLAFLLDEPTASNPAKEESP